eukprot:CAMPEP_0169164516 /NCGR_PEP_ID=MMETSP1015-20121227/58888_1 /TAXON_ID=342587 /ORGANISM="Karlodinium micrum, Strain CCMP2283" /LENGTH=587 /DNA_ID=CAMNT_0009236981 /DNA_START=60 /DNA_END=1823 /DNA_ORIENTATION=+
MTFSELNAQLLCELKQFILDSEQRVCDKLDKLTAKIQPMECRLATLESNIIESRKQSACSVMSEAASLCDLETDFFPWSSKGEDDCSLTSESPSLCDLESDFLPPTRIGSESKFSAWSTASLPQALEETSTPLTKVSEQANCDRPSPSTSSANATKTRHSIESVTPGAVQTAGTWKPTFLKTWHSAPSTFGDRFAPQTVGACEDCLRPDCVAWVEGQSVPVPISTIAPGQKVLCHDNLARGMKYAEVADVLIQSGSVEWVTVILEDGTQLDMTANHPTQPLANDGERHTVRAGDLRPGDDHIMVLRTMPVRVKDVIYHDESDDEVLPGNDRCFLTLKQPERHALFVAPAPSGKTGLPSISTMAVGSADAKALDQSLRLHVRNTFIDTDDSDEDQEARRPRSNSVPNAFNFNFEYEVLSPSRAENCAQANRFLTAHMESSNLSMSSCCSSAFSDSGLEHDNVILAPAMRSRFETDEGDMLDARPQTTIALSEITYMKKVNMRSMGCVGHAQGACTPCLFANRQQHLGADPCWKGALCDRCHGDHAPYIEAKPKSGRKRQRMAKKRRQAEAEEAEAVNRSAMPAMVFNF